MYVDSAWKYKPIKPVLDAEPSYEDIPQGLHDADEPRWQAADVRRYAYWSVFAGSCGHTYGHNAIMQFVRPGVGGAYFADGERKPWYKALDDPGFNQMRYLKQLMLTMPYFSRRPDQSIVLGNGTRYERLAATRGDGYLMVYNYTGREMRIDLSKTGAERNRHDREVMLKSLREEVASLVVEAAAKVAEQSDTAIDDFLQEERETK